MFLAFVLLLVLVCGLGFLVWLALRRLSNHLRENPQAAKLFAENVLAPVLFGKEKSAVKQDLEKTEEVGG